MTEDDLNALIVRAYEVYTAGSKATTTALLSALSGVTSNAKTYAFKHRLKSPRSIESKVRRKRQLGQSALEALAMTPESERDEAWTIKHRIAQEGATYSADNVTDVLGCRYVTLYQSEIPRIVMELLKAIEAYNKDDENDPIDASEFVIYTNRTSNDPISISDDTSRIVKTSPLFKDVPFSIREPESRKSAYSSVHLVFSHDVSIQHAGKEEVSERTFFEVQIRDIFEEGWGEVQHDLLYSEKDKFGEDAPADQMQWSLHLNALKTFVDGCSQHASIVKSNLDGLRASRAPSTTSQSVTERRTDLTHIVQALRRTKAQKSTEKKVSDGYTLLISGSDIADPDESLRRLGEAIANIEEGQAELSVRQAEAKVRNSGELTIGYFLQMESAAARVAIADLPTAKARSLQLRAEAEAIYERVRGSFPKDPTVHMRLGKVVEGRAQSGADFERSESLFDAAIALIELDPMTGPDHWMAISARIDKGVSIWRQIKYLSPKLGAEASLERLNAAAVATLDAYRIWQDQSPLRNELNKVIGHKAASNLVYFLAKIVEGGGTLSPEQEDLLTRMIEVVEGFGAEPYPDFYKTRDNLLHAYQALGRMDRVRDFATENFVELRAKAERNSGAPLDSRQIGNHLTGSAFTCFETAFAVLFGNAA